MKAIMISQNEHAPTFLTSWTTLCKDISFDQASASASRFFLINKSLL